MAHHDPRIRESEVQLEAVRSSGAGGQNVNKVSSAVHLRFDIAASSLPEGVKHRLLALKGPPDNARRRGRNQGLAAPQPGQEPAGCAGTAATARGHRGPAAQAAGSDPADRRLEIASYRE
jgi:hypothetical protein